MKASQTNPKKRNLIGLGVGTIVVILLIATGYIFLQSRFQNYAEEVARPIEAELVRAGAKEISSSGDNGRGSDNREPWYRVGFTTPLNKDRAIKLVNDIAKRNGYTLEHASPHHRGHLGAVADIYIENWYFDNTSKKASYPALANGPIRLAFAINYDQAVGSPDPESTTIELDIRLPSFK